MRITRLRLRTSSVLAALVCTAWLSACSDGDGTTDPTAGTSGSGPAGGKGGSSGKGGSAGKGGSGAGNGGSSGAAGAGAGGEPSEGGVGGVGAVGGEGAVSGQGAAGGEGGIGGEGAVSGQGAAAGEGGIGGEAGSAGQGATGGQGEAGLGGAGGEGGTPVVTCELLECGAACVDPDVGLPNGNTVSHCGACDRSCSVANASASTCEAGECAPTCVQGFDDCAADDGSGEDDGCETALALGNVSGQTVNDCGSCGHDCSLANATASTCVAGTCDPTCAAGFDDCDADDGSGEDDGCETAVTGTTHCGACGHACSMANTTAIACTDGLGAPTCAAGFLDCNVNGGAGADDGCETPNNTIASCGTTCANVAACEPGAACTASGCEAIGITVLTVPFTAANQTQRYGASHSTSAVDLTNDRVNVRLYAPGATAGSINVSLLDASGPPGASASRELTALNSGWVTVSIPVGPVAGDWDPSYIRQVLLDVSSGSTGPWANPTVVYVDRIWSDNGLLNDRFAADATPPMVMSGVTTVPGSTLTWTALLP